MQANTAQPQHALRRRPPAACALPSQATWQLGLLLLVFLAVQAPRFVTFGARMAASVFPSDRGYVDFDHAYYPAAQAIRHDPSALYRGVAYDDATAQLHLKAPAHFLNIPVVAWLFAPLTPLTPAQAGTVWLLINIGIALASLGLILNRIAPDQTWLRWGITIAFATSGPLLNALNLGQTTPFILLLLLLGERHLQRGQQGRAGLCLGLACLVKIPLLLFLPYFALRQRWRLIGAASAILLATTAVSLLCYGWALHVDYFNIAIRAQWGTSIAAHNCQSLDAFFARLFTEHSLWSWQPFVVTGWGRWLKWLTLGALMASCAWAFFTPRQSIEPQRTLLECGLVMAFALVAMPIAWVHYGTWLLPVVAVLGASLPSVRDSDRQTRWLAGGTLVAAVFLINFPMPPPRIVQRFGHETWFRLAISHQLIGTVLLLGLCVWAIRFRESTSSRRAPDPGSPLNSSPC